MIFSLDVGTRTVMGLVLEPKNNGLHIRAVALEEHKGRAMLDGQIQDIPEVARVVKNVKEKLENKIKKKLTGVSVAAAGRALKTVEASAAQECDPSTAISKDAIYALQIKALQNAQRKLSQNGDFIEYYCVGYSIKHHKLDGSIMQNLEGQFGSSMEVELIATFLPRIVVDSLHSVLNRCGLVVENLTLEPIAASHLIIEPGMRKLNLALVDIGAGTSDIAICREGSMIGYGMVPSAGDFITEKISEELLVDFTTAEAIKRQLNAKQYVEYRDVLGASAKKSSKEIIGLIEGVVKKLSSRIAEEIIKVNGGRPPSAVILIGGGSQTPGLAKCIADNLGLTAERVAVRDRSAIRNITGYPKSVRGPEAVTPLGIAFTRWQGEGISLEFVEVNGKMVRVFGSEQLKVVDVLYAAGIHSSAIYGKPGKGLTVEVNGMLKLIPGEEASPAEILVNGKAAALDSLVKKGDKIDFKVAGEGKPAKAKVMDLLPKDFEKIVTLNGERIEIKPFVSVNGRKVSYMKELADNDRITWNKLECVKELLAYCEIEYDENNNIFVNGTEASLNTRIKDGDSIILKNKKITKAKKPIENKGINITVNGESIKLNKENAILTDLFSAYDFPSTPPAGKKNLHMLINGEKANFVTPLEEGDEVKLEWR